MQEEDASSNEDEMEDSVSITDIADLLFQQFVIITGRYHHDDPLKPLELGVQVNLMQSVSVNDFTFFHFRWEI